MFNINKIFNLLGILAVLSVQLFSLLAFVPVHSQTLPNAINLYVPFVTVDGRRAETRNNGNTNYFYDGELKDGDLIRYGWDGVAIDLSYKQFPQVGGGWIRVYLDDDSRPENAITDIGNSPLPIKTISSRLQQGRNRIMLVFVDDRNNPSLSRSKVFFTFNYRSANPDPKISVLEPSDGSLLMGEGEKRFRLELQNFVLENNQNSSSGDKGIIKVFVNNTNGKPLTIIRSSQTLQDNKELVEFTNKQFDPDVTIPDSKATKLIFQLARSNGENLPFNAERIFVTNFGNTLSDIGLPEIRFVEPRADRVDLSVDGDRKFILEIKNFEPLSQMTLGENEDRKGYLQIFVDDTPIKTIWNKNEFTLNEIGYSAEGGGKKVVRAQLVNKDFTRLSPEVAANVDVVYKSANQEESNDSRQEDSEVTSNNWRLVIVGVIVLIIVLGILVLVIRG